MVSVCTAGVPARTTHSRRQTRKRRHGHVMKSKRTDPGARRATDDATNLLVLRVLRGETSAFDEIVRLHESHVYRTCLSITKNRQDAEDAMQDTFLNAYRSLAGFRSDSAFRTWLTRIAINEGLKRLRSFRETHSLDQMIETDDGLLPRQVQAWHPNPEQLYHTEELRYLMEQAVLHLAEPFRVVFVLRDICGLSNQEVAEQLKLSVPGVKSRLLRGRLMVRKYLNRYLVEPSSLRAQKHRIRSILRSLADRFCRATGLRR